jgi:hypothetical protein
MVNRRERCNGVIDVLAFIPSISKLSREELCAVWRKNKFVRDLKVAGEMRKL